jgi:ADP-heptose:LPS heptosyltransferase
MTWDIETSCGYEAQKVKYLTVPYTRGRGLDIGCGPQRVWPHALGIDRWISKDGAGLADDIERLSMIADQSVDWVFSSHALEDFPAERTASILKEWCRVVKPGGYLILYLPHEDHYPKVGEHGCNPAHQRNLKPLDVEQAMPKGWVLMEEEVRTGGAEYSFFQVFKQGPGAACWKSKSGKPTALVIRYGGFGDMLQASSVFPALVAKGYEVHVNTTPTGFAVVEHDPNVSGWLIQDKDQVPNDELSEYWAALPERYDVVINLSESVEETLLCRPGSKNHAWPHARRHFLLDRNYMEYTHAIAGVPEAKPYPRFFPTGKEARTAAKRRKGMGPGPVILWALSGSSLHKTYLHQDTVIATVLRDYPTAKIVLIGDEACQLLEAGWENEPRVICKSAKWGIRETLAFAEEADVVVGPETGVLNSVSMSPGVAKVILLSHSSEENLTKYWKNTFALTPKGLSCYPCHQMHYGKDYCQLDEETIYPKCTVVIPPNEVYLAIQAGLVSTKQRAA